MSEEQTSPFTPVAGAAQKPWQTRCALALAVTAEIDSASQTELNGALVTKKELDKMLTDAQAEQNWNLSNIASSLITQTQARIVVLQQVQADCTYYKGRVDGYAQNQPYYDQHPEKTPQKWYPMPGSMTGYLHELVGG